MNQNFTNQDQWTAVDLYITDAVVSSDPILDSVLLASSEAGLPAYHVAPNQGKLLMLMARAQGARRILEIGTLGGYSTIWLARALPKDGSIITLEAEAKHAEVARANFTRAGLSNVIELRIGAALDTLPKIAEEQRGPFDFIFIDADKPNNSNYFAWALKLSRPGTIIIVDNVVRNGAIADTNSTDLSVQGAQQLIKLLGSEPSVEATAIQTVGSKGYDGFAMAIVKETR